jgi:hypothetical protein
MRIRCFVLCFSLTLLIMAIPASSFAEVVISVRVGPPVLPVYAQPPCPGDGYMWTPGYWAYGPDGYYWVPGTWVMPPQEGVLWTPGYWGWNEGLYVWHPGYWGPHTGFYGGVNYGFGYFGSGYDGGYWRDRHFYYNRTVNNVTITNVHIYNKTVINNVTVNRVSYNGGPGGIHTRESREQETWARERHFEPTPMQRDHEHGAAGNRAFLASQNHGRPAIAATVRPGEFHAPRIVPAHSGGAPNLRVENHAVPRPENSPRYEERPMPREEMHGGRASRPEYNAPRQEGPSRTDAYRQENPRSHENAPHEERDGHSDRGHDQKPH